MQAPVASNDQSLFLGLESVTYITLSGRNLMFVTKDRSYRLVRSMSEIADALSGSQFVRVDQNVIVNMDRARKYDSRNRILYFEPSGEDQINSTYVSVRNEKIVSKYMGLK
jgi:Response regulator of the LytR/AlgR family